MDPRFNVELTGDEARFLLNVVMNAQVTVTGKDCFGIVALLNKINTIAINRPPVTNQEKEPS